MSSINVSDRNCPACGAMPDTYHADECEGGARLAVGVGDVHSTARGSGARFNGGKVPVELIPTWIIAATGLITDRPMKDGARYEARQVLDSLGDWQRNVTSALLVLQAFEFDWIEDCARVFDYGRRKYAEWNWAKGMAWSIPLACAVRHLLAILRGELNDPESGLPHRGHVACNIVMLAQYEQSYPEGDDRPWRLLTNNADGISVDRTV